MRTYLLFFRKIQQILPWKWATQQHHKLINQHTAKTKMKDPGRRQRNRVTQKLRRGSSFVRKKPAFPTNPSLDHFSSDTLHILVILETLASLGNHRCSTYPSDRVSPFPKSFPPLEPPTIPRTDPHAPENSLKSLSQFVRITSQFFTHQ